MMSSNTEIANWTSNELPLCTVCNHRHEQGVKCTICGHVGRSHMYLRMKAKSQRYSNFNVHKFDTHDTITHLDKFDFYRLMSIVNNIQEKCNYPAISVSPDLCCYFIGYLGNAPIAVTRWVYMQNNNNNINNDGKIVGTWSAVMDMVCVLEPYRLKGYGLNLINSLFEHAKAAGATATMVLVPKYLATETLIKRLNRDGFQPCDPSVTLPDGSPAPDSHYICQQL